MVRKLFPIFPAQILKTTYTTYLTKSDLIQTAEALSFKISLTWYSTFFCWLFLEGGQKNTLIEAKHGNCPLHHIPKMTASLNRSNEGV